MVLYHSKVILDLNNISCLSLMNYTLTMKYISMVVTMITLMKPSWTGWLVKLSQNHQNFCFQYPNGLGQWCRCEVWYALGTTEAKPISDALCIMKFVSWALKGGQHPGPWHPEFWPNRKWTCPEGTTFPRKMRCLQFLLHFSKQISKQNQVDPFSMHTSAVSSSACAVRIPDWKIFTGNQAILTMGVPNQRTLCRYWCIVEDQIIRD